ncbi:facilitated trehalose transporter Tret1-like isoform X1 [Galleria mellonella]|uniref:Facilitated trehalose transporter Tret1-like isoform X1 n=1 Tax=Galleria mellonella TaxID=7137 RepID=A0ABM3N7D7_GALME|nr:facilitated trehalose transporter Tret1-like isoform X1 [Galleria mellonella]
MSEKNNRKVQYLAGLCASLTFTFTGATLGWASPAIPKFKSGEANLEITDAQTSWVVSLLSVGALFGCYMGQVLNESVGRRRTILISAVPGLLGAIIILLTKWPELMYVGRFMYGLTTGSLAVVVMIYVTEIADKEIRGALGMLIQVMNNLGGLIMYGVGPFVSYTVLNSIILTIPITYALCCAWIPESPYYHLKNERIDAARKEFMFLKGRKDEKWIDEQLGIMRAHVRESMENKTTVKELLTNMKYRKALYIVAGLKIVQYMTGVFVIQSYLEVIFRQSSSISGPHVSIIYGFVQFGAGIGATFLSRWFGRRVLMLISCLGVSMSMTAIGLYFYLQEAVKLSEETMKSLSPLPLVGLFGFNILYAMGVGNLPYVMQVELFPVNVKAAASSLATMLACVLCFAVTKCYMNVKEIFGHYTVFWSFALIGYVGVLFIYFFVPETKGKTLEQVIDNMQKPAEAQPLQNNSEVKS